MNDTNNKLLCGKTIDQSSEVSGVLHNSLGTLSLKSAQKLDEVNFLEP